MNVVVLTGRLTADGDYRQTDTTSIYKFTMAVDRDIKAENGVKADFPRVVVFGKVADNCNKYLGKGKMVAVKGRLQTGRYENDKGDTIYTTDVIAERVDFLSPKEKEVEDNFEMLNEQVPF